MADNVIHVPQGGAQAPLEVCPGGAELGEAIGGPQGCPDAVASTPGCGGGSEHVPGVRSEVVRDRT